MTVADYITGVRDKLSDNVQPYRVSPADVASALAGALSRAKQLRASLRYQDCVPIADDADVNFAGSTSATVRAELDRYSDALIFLAAARCLVNDNADTLNVALADKWDKRGTELLGI